MAQKHIDKQRSAVLDMTSEERLRAQKMLQNDVYTWAQGVSLIARRLHEDKQSGVEFMVDLRLLVLSLRGVIRSAETYLLFLDGDDRAELEKALARVEQVVPHAIAARNVFEHFDDYLLGIGRDRRVGVPVQFYKRGASQIEIRVGPLVIDVNKAANAADHLGSVVVAGRDHLAVLGE